MALAETGENRSRVRFKVCTFLKLHQKGGGLTATALAWHVTESSSLLCDFWDHDFPSFPARWIPLPSWVLMMWRQLLRTFVLMWCQVWRVVVQVWLPEFVLICDPINSFKTSRLLWHWKHLKFSSERIFLCSRCLLHCLYCAPSKCVKNPLNNPSMHNYPTQC